MGKRSEDIRYKENDPGKDMPSSIVEHLEEVRSRVIRSLVVIVINSCFVYYFIDEIIRFLARPVQKLVFIMPQEAFITKIKISLFLGLFLAFPFILYQIWKFISIALKPNERKYILIFGPLSFIFFILGYVFGYFVIIPVGIKYLLGFGSDVLIPMLTVSKYINFVGFLIFMFGIIFQMPLIMVFLVKVGLVKIMTLTKRRKEAIAMVFILAAVITPPDVVTQILVALPLIVLYETGIIFSKIF